MLNKYIKINPKVEDAIKNKKPVVALESTLISHGLPYPENIKVANESIKAVEESGSIAATIGIINGEIKIGLDNNDIDILATSTNVQKVSLHNIALSFLNKQNAATTVAATINIASKIGISFFATGGIGGVHLGVEKNNDVSADLTELSRTRMFVVSSGAKSILDLEKTFEMLETYGIPRISFNSDFMPGFWYEETEFKVDKNFKNIDDISNYLKIIENLKHKSSVLIFNKVPDSKGLEKIQIEKWINQSVDKANSKNITGKELTPFLISEMNQLSNNKTLEANTALIINNALLAGKISKEFYS
ncbi:MAG: pseudouridine-5'-phosphate glycosidase [Pelagibacteraceae bacterium]|nr:pseudouridine-5'-phosphate glycosidase [Pelagibacteraceae bacterium]MBT4645384.1 pseudouridine-5'-phosphate glycosidase [Pelagibacteraceae bacterium]MBT4951836.1 pseudouridine-5'-phosphate glycosidase [Pelagibacteraceae bacterium]MBT6353613.1 pseudouridine-5'-phosphate glycosidase [Pelagibacteraceae bacterium]